MGWRITIKGAVLNEEDVTGAHVTIVNDVLGAKGWDAIDPMVSPEALMMWGAIAISETTKSDLQESMVFIQTLPLQEIIAGFTPDASTLPPEPPKTDPGPVTPEASEIDAERAKWIRETWMKTMAESKGD